MRGPAPAGPPRSSAQKRACYVSVAGDEFLKSSTSAPDFLNGVCQGVPDQYSGKSLVFNDFHLEPYTFAQGYDTYLIFAPIPGVAYGRILVPNGTNTFTNQQIIQSVSFKDAVTFFPSLQSADAFSDNTAIVDKFRYIALSAEIESTTNDMTWTGNIQLIKAPISFSVIRDATGYQRGCLTGLDSIRNLASTYGGGSNNAEGNVHAASFKDGVYTTSLNKDPAWMFNDIHDGSAYGDLVPCPINQKTTAGTFDQLRWQGSVVGMGTMDAIIMKVSIPSGPSDMSALLKVYHTVEYQPTFGTIMSMVATPSAHYDPCALALYQVLYANLPLGVPSRENANFWSRVLKLIQSIAGPLKILPGPAGRIADGVLAGASLLEGLSK